MPLNELIHKPERAYAFFNPCATLTGKAGRGSILSFHDSTGRLLVTNDQGSQYTPTDYPRGHWEAYVYALVSAGFHLWGLPMSNCPASGTDYNAITSVGSWPTESLGMSDDPADNATLTAGRSYDAGNNRFLGPLIYVPGDTTYPASNNYNYATAYMQDDPLSLSSGGPNGWRNNFLLGNPTAVALRVLFSYATNSAGVDVKFSAWSLFASILHSSLRVTANTAGEMVDASLLVPDRPATTTNRYFSCYDPINDVRSQGPIIVSHVQWIDGDIDPTDTTSGQGGVSVTPVFIKINYTMSQLNSELAYQGTAALAETLRCAYRVAGQILIDLRMMGNDIFYTGVDSFIYGTDTPTNDASGGAGGSGADQSTGPGIVQNLWSFAAQIDAARILAGIPKDKVKIQWGFYHSQPDSTLYGRFEDAIDAACAWIDSGAQFSEYFFVVKGHLVASPAHMLREGWYNSSITPITAITTCSAGAETTITATGHGLQVGDLVRFTGTNATTASGNALNGNVLNNGVDWKVSTYVDANNFKVVSPLAITGAGNTGWIVGQRDRSHMTSRGLLGFNAAGVVQIGSALQAYSQGLSEGGGGTLSNRFPRFQGAN